MNTIVRVAVATLLYGVILFALAGTIRWPAGWAFLALMGATLVAYTAILLVRHPDLIAERSKPPKDAKSWDKPLVAFVGGIGPLMQLVVSALDHRFGWSEPMPIVLVLAGFVLMAAGGTLTNLAVATNRFFSGIIRIQTDRGHHVIDSGPYGFVRHPGYVGSVLHTMGAPLALGSWWALLVGVVICAVLAVRTALEDRTLRAELAGYDDYARRVRFRLIPGLW